MAAKKSRSTSKKTSTTKKEPTASATRKRASRAQSAGDGAAQAQPQAQARAQPQQGEPMVLSHDQIAKRAYQIWQSKGQGDGNDLNNWVEAEQQLRQQQPR